MQYGSIPIIIKLTSVWQLSVDVNWEWRERGGHNHPGWGQSLVSVVFVISVELLQYSCPELCCHFRRYCQKGCRAPSQKRKCFTKDQNTNFYLQSPRQHFLYYYY